MRPVTVVIPVYNAFNDALECLKSVFLYTSKAEKILVIDDASTQGDFKMFLPWRFKFSSKLEIIRNKKNLGFVKTCNKGMKLAGNTDIVLLNSDTIVTKAWLHKMQLAAYSSKNIATVTPLTNNGTICSFPTFCGENAIPEGYTLKEFSHLIEKTSENIYPEIPTAVGFCMYIKREAINKVGYFDEEFGLGYGEENDFCCRCKKYGYINILDDATYIYHKGSASFLDKKDNLQSKNSQLLEEKHPEYFKEVEQFISKNPLLPIHAKILDEMVWRWLNQKKHTILFFLHNGPYSGIFNNLGGTEYHVQDIINNSYKNKDFAFWSLVPLKDNIYKLTAHISPSLHREYRLTFEQLERIIDKNYFNLIHLQHSLRFGEALLPLLQQCENNYIVSIHDYYLFCPRIFMVTEENKLCNGFECTSTCGYPLDFISNLRDKSKLILNNGKKIIVFSKSSVNILTKFLGEEPTNIDIIPHGIKNKPNATVKEKNIQEDKILRILFIGNFTAHKGVTILKEAIQCQQIANKDIEWHIFGYFDPNLLDKDQINTGNAFYHGFCQRNELTNKIIELNPHLGIVPSICNETYNLTLNHFWSLNVPTIVTPFGAIYERTVKHNIGWAMKQPTAEALIATIKYLIERPKEYSKTLQRLKKLNLISVEEEIKRYKKIYLKLAHPLDKANINLLMSYLIET